jgi:circadian clock protein KaiB
VTQRLLLRLYVTGTARSAATVEAVRRFGADFAGGAEVVVVDVLADPAAAERDGVLATPLLVLAEPEPERRVVGYFADADDVREALDL